MQKDYVIVFIDKGFTLAHKFKATVEWATAFVEDGIYGFYPDADFVSLYVGIDVNSALSHFEDSLELYRKEMVS